MTSSIGPNLPAPRPVDAVAVVCGATYYADLRDEYAFTFRVIATNTRFTIYASRADRYEVGGTYTLILAAPDAVTLPLGVEDVALLRTCLDNAAHRWREAITQADAGAERPHPHPHPQPTPPPGYLNAEPTPAGYRAAGHLFRDELDRVEQINARLGEYQRAAKDAADGDRP